MKDDREFQVGDEVAVIVSSLQSVTVACRTKVKKQYKNGNLVLERGDYGQFRKGGNSAARHAGFSTNLTYLMHVDDPRLPGIELLSRSWRMFNSLHGEVDTLHYRVAPIADEPFTLEELKLMETVLDGVQTLKKSRANRVQIAMEQSEAKTRTVGRRRLD